MLEDLARIASLAIENARLEERERHIARTLQDSLLPRALPEIEGLEVGARYLAGGEGTVVGGDLYDLFPVEDEWALVVGDVCGKGAEAAALTGMVRYTLRAESLHHASPCEVLRLLNEAILRQLGDGASARSCTGARRSASGSARLVLASAGHPPPLVLRADGAASRPCELTGPLLGVMPAVVHPDVIVDLGAGDALVCFTDGVIEGRGPGGMFGDDRLEQLLAASAGVDAGALADRIVEAAVAYQGGRLGRPRGAGAARRQRRPARVGQHRAARRDRRGAVSAAGSGGLTVDEPRAARPRCPTALPATMPTIITVNASVTVPGGAHVVEQRGADDRRRARAGRRRRAASRRASRGSSRRRRAGAAARQRGQHEREPDGQGAATATRAP